MIFGSSKELFVNCGKVVSTGKEDQVEVFGIKLLILIFKRVNFILVLVE